MAHKISQIVSNIPDMPLVDTNSFSETKPVSKFVLPYNVIKIPLKTAQKSKDSEPAILTSKSVWKITAIIVAITTEANNVIKEGTFL